MKNYAECRGTIEREFPVRLKNARKQKNLTQEVLAARGGVSIAAISNYEMGKRMPTADVLGALSSVLECSCDWLLGLSEK